MPMKMEMTEGSETSAISIVTPGNYPKENILHAVTFVWKNIGQYIYWSTET